MIKIVNAIRDLQSFSLWLLQISQQSKNWDTMQKLDFYRTSKSFLQIRKGYTVIIKGSVRCATYGSSCSSANIVRSKEPRRRDLLHEED